MSRAFRCHLRTLNERQSRWRSIDSMRVRLHGEKEREKNIIDVLAAKPAAIDVAAHANHLVVDALGRCDLGASPGGRSLYHLASWMK